MGQISVNADDKDWFDEFKESDENQPEAFHRMRRQAEAFQGQLVDHEKLAEELEHKLVTNVHLAAYRGTREYMEADD